MDVICDRCRTRYDFDDALVPTRGTTVKCTQCGHQFRVFRPDGSAKLTGWTVRLSDGSELRFGAMRELQAAITSRIVDRDALLVPGDGGPERVLGKIDELRALFPKESAPDEAPTGAQRPRTTATGRPPAPVAMPRVATPHDEAPPSARSGDTLPPPAPSPSAGSAPGLARSTQNTPLREAQLPAAPQPSPSYLTGLVETDATLARVEAAVREGVQEEPFADDDTIGGASDEPGRAPSHAGSTMRDPSAASLAPHTPSPSAARPSVLRRSDTYSEPNVSSFSRQSSRPSFGKWLAGLLVLGGLSVVAVAVVKRNAASSSSANDAHPPNEKVTRLLAEGDRLLLAGELGAAREQFVRASGVDESDPRILHALARVAVVQADLAWLAARLEPTAPSAELERAVERASQDVAPLEKAQPSGQETTTLRLDALRLRGHLAEARKLAAGVGADTPDGARALAALDLAEPSPGWDVAVDRLRVAARAEQKLGRARALLVYALAGRGELDGARRELADLEQQSPTFLLLGSLKRYLDSKPSATSKSGSASAAAQPKLTQDRGETAKAPKDDAEMLKDNPDFVPGLIGVADSKWASGDKAGAIALYQRVRESAPGTPWADHAARRLAEGSTKPPSDAPPPPPREDDGPAPIDTSDLPE